MNLTWLGIVVLVLIAGACITGFQKGFVKEVVATFFVLFIGFAEVLLLLFPAH